MDDVLGLFQEHPLLLRAEVEERGTDYLVLNYLLPVPRAS